MKITSDTHLLILDRHMRVTAGSGAGKTYWLVGHAKNIITRSGKLHPNAKIGIISYTNVAADELRQKLGKYNTRADISTIHSFLYRHVIRPYMHLLRDSTGKPLVNASLLDGHDEHRVNYQHLSAWLTSNGLQQLLIAKNKEQLDQLKEHLAGICWQQGTELSQWRLVLPKDYGLWNKVKVHLTPERLLTYKGYYWQEGTIDHDDVLYFAFRILHEFPVLRECLSARFPFLLVDEFQDTVPAQTQILRWLGQAGSTVVVIGDAEQAIFEFAGAAPAHFHTFTLPDLDGYELVDNRRSTQRIITLLNHVRSDGLEQACVRQT